MTSTENREPKGSEHSSTDLCRCGHVRRRHGDDGCSGCVWRGMTILSNHVFIPNGGLMPEETENEVNAHQHIRIGLALLVEDREHWHSRDDIAAFLQAELEHAFEEAA